MAVKRGQWVAGGVPSSPRQGCFLQAFTSPAPFPPGWTQGHVPPPGLCSSHLGRGPLHLGLPDTTAPFCSLTWKTLAAETRQARAEESVAPKMPAVIRGAKPDTMLMVCRDAGCRPQGEGRAQSTPGPAIGNSWVWKLPPEPTTVPWGPRTHQSRNWALPLHRSSFPKSEASPSNHFCSAQSGLYLVAPVSGAADFPAGPRVPGSSS